MSAGLTRGSKGYQVTRLDPLESAAEKTRSLDDFLRQVSIACLTQNGDEKWAAQERLENLYGSVHNAWDDPGRPYSTRGMASSSGTAGGYTVPADLRAEVLNAAGDVAIVRPRALVVPAPSGKVAIPVLDSTVTPDVGGLGGYFSGGMSLAWTAEAAAITEDSPLLKGVEIPTHELTGIFYASRALVMNSAAPFGPLARRLFSEAVAYAEDWAFLRGDGSGQPLGVLNSPAVLATAARGSNSAIGFTDIRRVWGGLLPSSRARAVFLLSHDAELAFLDATSTADSAIVPTQVNPLNRAPLIVTEKLPDINNAGDFGAFDFGMYVVADGGMEIAASEHFLWRTQQIAYRVVHRVGGQPWPSSTVTLGNSDVVSPFSILAPA